jgi:hypothetical protein
METRQTEELTLRQYLLGRLGASSEITERLEERILIDGNFAELAGMIEDEIIEDYLENALDPEDRGAVEKHFLRPPERQEKLRFARLVNRSLENRAAVKTASATEGEFPVLQVSKPPSSVWRPSTRMWAELATCALLALSFAYAFKAHQELQETRVQSGQQLTAERGRSVQLERQLQDLRKVAAPTTVMLSLLQPGIRRGDGHIPTLQIGSGTERIHVEIALQSVPPVPVDVRLESAAGKRIWTAYGLAPVRADESAILTLDVPTQGIEPGDYRFVVAQAKGVNVTYAFSVSKL